MPKGFLYLVAVMDWHSRFVLSWRLSNTMDTHLCMEALEAAFAFGVPEVFNAAVSCAVDSPVGKERVTVPEATVVVLRLHNPKLVPGPNGPGAEVFRRQSLKTLL